MFYFIGIKGTGMAALACILHDAGNEVAGSDLDKHFFTEEPLRERNIPIYPFNSNHIHEGMTVIIGNAFLEDFEEVKVARSTPNVTCYRYHEYVGKLMENYISIGIAGSHGKTTTTGLLASVMNESFPCGYLIGDGTGVVHLDSKYLCVEADEYRRHFIAYHPDYAIITNVEIDHVDYYKTPESYREAFEDFASQVKKTLLVFGDDPETRKLKLSTPHYWYGVEDNDDIQAKNIVETDHDMAFDVWMEGKMIYRFSLPFVGRHMLWDSLGVIGLALVEGMDPKLIEEGLRSFKGVKRRFVIEKEGDNIFVDDYAHHPTEVSVTLDAARKRFPEAKLIAVFKPHRVSRVYYFADDFAKALSKANEVYLCDFTSIDDQEEGINIDIHYLQERIPGSKILSEDEEGAKQLAQEAPGVYLFLSSKDIYFLADLVKKRLK